MTKSTLLSFVLGLIIGVALCLIFAFNLKQQVINPSTLQIDRSLDKYTIENLSKANIKPGKFEIAEVLGQTEKYISHKFYFEFNPNLDGKSMFKTTGMINFPILESGSNESPPVILMIRGFVDQDSYRTGMGTRNAANFFAENGFITVAPDFLGFGDSDPETTNIFESRFQTYVTIVSLINSLPQINPLVKPDKIGIWAHSNGGQIALTALEITQKKYPTVVWAPVTKPFPYSILYYTDESDDLGKYLRGELAKYEKLYDPNLYSMINYTKHINAPIQLNQGMLDVEVPVMWSDEFVSKLQAENKDITYLKYSGADHNMRPKWDEAVLDNLNFFTQHLHAN